MFYLLHKGIDLIPTICAQKLVSLDLTLESFLCMLQLCAQAYALTATMAVRLYNRLCSGCVVDVMGCGANQSNAASTTDGQSSFVLTRLLTCCLLPSLWENAVYKGESRLCGTMCQALLHCNYNSLLSSARALQHACTSKYMVHELSITRRTSLLYKVAQ